MTSLICFWVLLEWRRDCECDNPADNLIIRWKKEKTWRTLRNSFAIKKTVLVLLSVQTLGPLFIFFSFCMCVCVCMRACVRACVCVWVGARTHVLKWQIKESPGDTNNSYHLKVKYKIVYYCPVLSYSMAWWKSNNSNNNNNMNNNSKTKPEKME